MKIKIWGVRGSIPTPFAPLGIRDKMKKVLSLATPKDIAAIKRVVRATTIERCQMIARKVSRFDSDRQVLNFLRDETRAIDPEDEF